MSTIIKVPVVVAVLVLLWFSIAPFLPERPLWLKNFAAEQKEDGEDVEPIESITHKRPWLSIILLTIISLAAAIANLAIDAMYGAPLSGLLYASPWVCELGDSKYFNPANGISLSPGYFSSSYDRGQHLSCYFWSTLSCS